MPVPLAKSVLHEHRRCIRGQTSLVDFLLMRAHVRAENPDGEQKRGLQLQRLVRAMWKLG